MALLPFDRTCHKLSYRVIVRSFSYSVLSLHQMYILSLCILTLMWLTMLMYLNHAFHHKLYLDLFY